MSQLLPLPVPTFKDKFKSSPEIGREGELKWLPIGALRIDPNYQREVGAPGKKNIQRIVERFAWRKFSPLVVSPRDGGFYAVIDGQHRAIAAMLHGRIKQLPCLILHCRPSEEADAFATINGNVTRIHAQAMFKARLAAGDGLAESAQRAAAAAGVQILAYPLGPKVIKANQTMACGTIETCCQFYGSKILTAALKCILLAAKGKTGMLRSPVIRGFCAAFFEHPDWAASVPGVALVVARRGLGNLVLKAMQDSANAGHMAVAGLIQKALHELVTSDLVREAAE